MGIWTRLSGVARRLSVDARGNVAMLFGLSLPALILMTLGGVDIHRASTVRINLQDALDAATLAAARSPHITNSGLQAVGIDALRANLSAYPQITLREDQTTFILNEEGIVVANAKVDVRALVANIVLPPYGRFMDDVLPVAARSEVFRSNKMVEVALILDNTGSMSGTKLTNTKAAAVDLIDRLAAADARSVEPDAVKISLVPFSMTVRVHEGFDNQANVSGADGMSWLSQATDHTGATGSTGIFSAGVNRFALLDTLRIGWAGCIESRPYPYDTLDTAPISSNQATMFVPFFAPDTPDREDINGDNTWKNWSFSNDWINDFEAAQASSFKFSSSSARETAWFTRTKNVSKYARDRLRTGLGTTSKGPNKGCSLEPVMRLTDDFDDLKTAVRQMNATGNTNVPLGMMWGWHTLSPNAPFSDGQAYGTDRLQKIAILMTDGENVNSTASNPDNSVYAGVGLIWQNRLGVGSGSSGTARRNAMDARLAELCTNMRDQDIIIYTVGVQVDSRTQTLLRECATSPGNYFNVTNVNDIGQAFDRIAGAIENLRIAG